MTAVRRHILSTANSLLSQASSWNRVLRGFMAWLVVLQLIGGMGAARFVSIAHDTDSRYDASSVIAQSDACIDDLLAADPTGNGGPGDDEPFNGASFLFANSHHQSVPAEGQVAFGLPGSTIDRAIHPTGPPFLS